MHNTREAQEFVIELIEKGAQVDALMRSHYEFTPKNWFYVTPLNFAIYHKYLPNLSISK